MQHGEKSSRNTWYRSPIDRRLLGTLTKRKNVLPFLHLTALLGISAATGIFAFWSSTRLPGAVTAAAIYLHCTFYGFFGGGTGLHEMSHNTVFRSKALNEIFIRLVGFLTYINFVQFRGNHTRHHLFTTIPDVDLEVTLPLPFDWRVWLWGITINIPAIKQIFPAMFRHCIGKRAASAKTDRVTYPSDDPRDIRSMIRWSRIIIGGHLALAFLFIITGNWILIFLITFAPFIGRWFFLLTHRPQHIGMQGGVYDWRYNTRTYLAGRFVRFFYWNMNYHIEHHMFAAVPYYHLPALREAIEDDLPTPRKGLIETWKEIAAYLREHKKDPGHFIEPRFSPGANEQK